MKIHTIKIRLVAVRLGTVVITPVAKETLNAEDVANALRRHSDGDWGDVCPEDAEENNRSILDGCRLLSAYRDRQNTKFWIITEADRSSTTILLPDEY